MFTRTSDHNDSAPYSKRALAENNHKPPPGAFVFTGMVYGTVARAAGAPATSCTHCKPGGAAAQCGEPPAAEPQQQQRQRAERRVTRKAGYGCVWRVVLYVCFCGGGGKRQGGVHVITYAPTFVHIHMSTCTGCFRHPHAQLQHPQLRPQPLLPPAHTQQRPHTRPQATAALPKHPVLMQEVCDIWESVSAQRAYAAVLQQ